MQTDVNQAIRGFSPEALRGYAAGLRRARLIYTCASPQTSEFAAREADLAEGFAARLEEAAQAGLPAAVAEAIAVAPAPPAAPPPVADAVRVQTRPSRGKPPPQPASGRRSITDLSAAEMAELRAAWESGTGVNAAARRLGVPVPSLYSRAAREGWTRAAAAPPPPPPVAAELSEAEWAEARAMLAKGQGAKALHEEFEVHSLAWWQAWCERERAAGGA